MQTRGTHKGFTLIELIITVTLLAMLTAIILVLTQPGKRFSESRDTKRQADVTAIVQALEIYQVDQSIIVPGLNTNLKMIGSAQDNCAVDCAIPTTDGIGPDAGGLGNDLVLWLDASAIDGLADGDFVETWEDKSVQGNDVTNANPNFQPTYQSNAIGGQPALRFDGSDGLEDATFQNYAGSVGATVFVVLNSPDDQTNRLALSAMATGGPSFPRLQKYPLGVAHRWLTGTFDTTWRYSETTAFAPNVNHLYLSVFDGAQPLPDDRVSLWINNEEQSLRRGAGDPTLTVSDVDRIIVGRWTNGKYPWIGDIAEVILYNRALSENERNLVQAYLNTKYSLGLAIGGQVVETDDACLDIAGDLQQQLPQMPHDPLQGSVARTYYAAMRSANGSLLVAACAPELTSPISAER